MNPGRRMLMNSNVFSLTSIYSNSFKNLDAILNFNGSAFNRQNLLSWYPATAFLKIKLSKVVFR